MFPLSSSLHHGVSLLSTGSHRPGSPPSPILRRRYAILSRTPVAYDFAFRLPRFPPSFRALACALPVKPEAVRQGQGRFDAGDPHSGFLHADNSGLLRFPAGPSHTYAVLQDPGRIEAFSPKSGAPTPPPHPRQRRLRQHMISWPTHGFSIRCLRFTNSVAAAHARPASGWLARLCRQGVEPSGPIRKVSSSTSHPPFQGLS